ncbi:MAG: efflux RND transporter periplasmic adaptor subunit [Gammaproteobacteria bacterium]|nr:MAG: efflux RND transporter periplasmic adaptor subunit [Gammaproteobacteria bacterium]
MRIITPGRFLLLLLLGGAALGLYRLLQPEPVPVTLARATVGPVTATVANTRSGTVKACRRSWLSPASGGQVVTLTVSEGDRVNPGQLLLELWNEDLRANLELRRRQAVTARAEARQACALAEGARREARRLQTLLARRLVADEKADQAETEAAAREAACNAAKARTAAAEAAVEVSRGELDRTRLRAPFAGVVAEVNTEQGEYVTPSPPGIATLPAIDLIDDSCLYVSAPIDEVDAPRVRVGMPVCVTLDAFPEPRCSGRIRRIAPYIQEREKQARTLEVEVELADPAEREGLLPGYSADIEVTLERREQTLRIPTEALFEERYVLYYDPADSRLHRREVRTGLANWEYTEVLEGLAEGDRIVLSLGREGVVDGALARPASEAGDD